MSAEFVDVVVRVVRNRGFLPIVLDQEGRELYRGEFQGSSLAALRRGFEFANRAQLTEHQERTQ